jgi:cell division protein FtsB
MQKVILVEDAVLRDTFWNAAIDLKKENDELKQRIKRLEDVLREIANEDYRGGRSVASEIAFRALKEAKP